MQDQRQKKIIVSVTNDLVTDQRVHKVCTSLQTFGYDVMLVGRLYANSLKVEGRTYATKRMKLFFKKSVLFYAEYNIRLFLLLLFKKTDSLLSNDLDTLPANYLVSILRRKKLYYDSHEYYTEVPELVDRSFVKKFWETVEGMILPRLKATYTVSETVAKAYKEKYNVQMQVIRNFPRLSAEEENREGHVFNRGQHIILYQGVVNVHRGLEEMIEAMKYVSNAVFYIIGRGDIAEKLRAYVIASEMEDRVKISGMVPFERLPVVTKAASIGVSLEKPVGLNYTYALPNKLFDYIHAEIPVLVSPLPEIQKIMQEFKIGEVIESHDPKEIAEKLNQLLTDNNKRELLKSQLKLAKKKYCWENEEVKLKKLFAT